MAPLDGKVGKTIDASTTDALNNTTDVDASLMKIVLDDYDTYALALPRQEQYRMDVKALLSDTDTLKNAPTEALLGELIKEGNRIGGVEDITARAARDILRVRGQSLDGDAGIDEVFATYGLKLPPIGDIKFQDYESLDDEHEKLDGWAAQAKAAYNLQMRSKAPELIAYRDEVFQKIDNTAKSLKRKVGATDSGFVDFLGRLAEGAASTLDSVGLDSAGDFLRKHSATNPEWDDSTSAIVGQALGQAGALVGSVLAVGSGVGAVAGVAGVSAGTAGALSALGRLGTVAASSLGGVQGEREKRTLEATGSQALADAASTDITAYGEAALDTVIDLTLLGTGKLGAGKAAKALVGAEGRALAATGLKDSAMKVAGSNKLLQKIADTGGDVLWQGTKEGATEALQGAIQDTSLGRYTNMRDTFEPLDVRNRAADFLGGFAGGAGITAVNKFVLPKDKVPTPPPPPDATDKDIADAIVAYTSADSAESAAVANNTFVEKAADAITSSILKSKDFAGALSNMVPETTKAKVADTTVKMYQGMKDTLGNLINHPQVQAGLEILLDNFDRSRSYQPPPRPSDAELAQQEAAKAAEDPVTPTIEEPAISTPTVEAPATIEAAVDTATELVTDPTATSTEQLQSFEKALEGLPTISTTDLGGGVTRYGFSLAQGGQSTSGLAQAQQELGVSLDDGQRVTTVGSGNARRASISYEIDRQPDGNYAAFKISKGKRIPVENVKTEQDATAFVNALKAKEQDRMVGVKGRANAQVMTDRFLTRAVPASIADILPDAAKRFVQAIRPRQGGNATDDVKRVNAYIASEQAFDDLVESGLSEEEALNNISRLRAVANDEFSGRNERLAALREVQWNLARTHATPQQLSEFVDANYTKPDVNSAVRKGLGLTNKLDTAMEQAQAVIESTPEPAPLPTPEQPQAATPTSVVVDTGDLSKNRSVQRMALERRYGAAQGDKIDALLASAKKSRQSRALVEFEADRFLKEIGATPDDDYESAMIKASKANVGAFKTRKDVSLKRGSFALNRVFNSLGIPITSDLPRNAAFDQPTKTGEFNPSEGTISVLKDVVGSQQAIATKWHELGEYASQGTTNFLRDVANATGIPLNILQAEAQQTSNDLRDQPIGDAREQGIDAVAQYLYDKAELEKTAPNLVQALDLYTQANPDSFLADASDAISKIDSMSNTELRQQFEAEQEIGRAASVEALKTRNVEPTLTPKQLLQSIRQRVFDVAANVKDLSLELSKAQGLPDVYDTFRKYYNQFKNREQTSALAMKSIFNHYKRYLEPLKISPETLANYLVSTRINGELAYWEQTIKDAGLTGDDLANIFNNSPTFVELTKNDPALFDALMAEVLQGSTPVNPRALITLLQELAAKSIATSTETQAKLALEIASTATTPELKDALEQAFNPKVMSRRRIDNPGGLDANDAAQMLFDMQQNLSPEQWKALENFRANVMGKVIVNAIEDARAAGIINDTQADYYISNKDNYVTLQMADMLASDPYIDASFTRQYGFDPSKTASDSMIVTGLKMAAIKARAISQRFANQITDMYYKAQSLGIDGTKAIRPVLYTVNLANANPWVNSYTRANPTADRPAIVDLNELYEKRAVFSYNNPSKSYVITAQDGTFVLHEVDDPTITEVLNPSALARRNEVLDGLNKTQVLARMFFTTNNPIFALRSLPKMTANLYRTSKIRATGTVPTTREMLIDFLKSPILGIPLSKEDRALIKHAYKAAFSYMRNAGNPDVLMSALNNQFTDAASFNDLMAQDALFRLVQGGDILVNTASGIDPTTVTELFGPNSIFASIDDQEIDQLISGTKGQKNILQRMSEYGWAGQKATRSVANAVQRYLAFTSDMNNALELGEKYLGILAFMRDGMPFNQAVVEANRYFGNPDPKGGGAARKAMSPFSLYTNSILQSMPVMYEIATKAGVSKDANQQLLKAAGMALRNRLFTSPIIAGGAVYAISKALGGSDDEAEKASQVMQRLINNIPEQDRKSGTAIPLMFRDPRSGDLYDTDDLTSPDDIDPSWTTVYLSVPYDPATAAISGFLGGMFDAIDKGLGVPSIVANTLTSSLGQMVPTLGPLAESGLALTAIARGQNPTNTFTGQPVVSDEEYEQGGLQLGMRYVEYLASHFLPTINFDKRSPGDKTKFLEPSGYQVLDMFPKLLKMGMVKESNYGQIQRNTAILNEARAQEVAVKEMLGETTTNGLRRITELERDASQRFTLAKDRAKSQGLPEKEAGRFALEQLPPGTQKELAKLRVWKNGYYKPLLEKAEIALYQGDTATAQQFIDDIDKSYEATVLNVES